MDKARMDEIQEMTKNFSGYRTGEVRGAVVQLLQAVASRDAQLQRMRKALGKIMDEHDHTCQEINGPCLHCIAQKALSGDGEGDK